MLVKHGEITLQQLNDALDKAKEGLQAGECDDVGVGQSDQPDEDNVEDGHVAVFRHEPFILSVECSSLESANKLVNVAISAGFRESGITSVSKRFMVSVRCSLRLEVPLSSGGQRLVPASYLEYLVSCANKKFRSNASRTRRLFEDFRRSFPTDGDNQPANTIDGVSDSMCWSLVVAKRNTPSVVKALRQKDWNNLSWPISSLPSDESMLVLPLADAGVQQCQEYLQRGKSLLVCLGIEEEFDVSIQKVPIAAERQVAPRKSRKVARKARTRESFEKPSLQSELTVTKSSPSMAESREKQLDNEPKPTATYTPSATTKPQMDCWAVIAPRACVKDVVKAVKFHDWTNLNFKVSPVQEELQCCEGHDQMKGIRMGVPVTDEGYRALAAAQGCSRSLAEHLGVSEEIAKVLEVTNARLERLDRPKRQASRGVLKTGQIRNPQKKNFQSLSPRERLNIRMKELLIRNSLPTDSLMKDVPSRWEILGDMALLPATAFASREWESLHGQNLWELVADSLKVRRLARQNEIKQNLMRESLASLLLGDDGWVRHRENGLIYCLDATKSMFSSGNGTEKKRMGQVCRPGDIVVDLYAGIGYFTLPFLVHGKAAHGLHLINHALTSQNFSFS